VEVKIGIQFASRELVVESGQTSAQVEKAIADALQGDKGVLTLVDDKGRKIVVPADKLAYVEIAEAESRRVGFGS
jgi:hypothetical protein